MVRIAPDPAMNFRKVFNVRLVAGKAGLQLFAFVKNCLLIVIFGFRDVFIEETGD